MTSEYSLVSTLNRIYVNQVALEAALMELVIWAEQAGAGVAASNARGALEVMEGNAGYIRQGLAKLKADSHMICRRRNHPIVYHEVYGPDAPV